MLKYKVPNESLNCPSEISFPSTGKDKGRGAFEFLLHPHLNLPPSRGKRSDSEIGKNSREFPVSLKF
jgi:hypothetical protein